MRSSKVKRRPLLRDAPSEPPPAPRRRHLTIDELQRLLGAVRKGGLRDEALFSLIYETGMRRSEAGVMRLSYVRQLHSRREVYVHRGKGSISGYWELSTSTTATLIAHIDSTYPDRASRNPEAFLFPGKRSAGMLRGLTGRHVHRLFSAYAKDAGLPDAVSHPHVLKHSRVQHLLEGADAQGLSIEALTQLLAQLVGHRNAMTTIVHYLRLTGREAEFARAFTEQLMTR